MDERTVGEYDGTLPPDDLGEEGAVLERRLEKLLSELDGWCRDAILSGDSFLGSRALAIRERMQP